MEAILMAILIKAFQLFLVLDPIGNTGIIATLISGFSRERQKHILYRELLLALLTLMVIFFLGKYLLIGLGISEAAITITGGIIFMFFSISLLFPGSGMVSLKNLEEEPFFVPIAMPLIIGPSSIATVILYSNDQDSFTISILSVLLAWLVTAIIIALSPIMVEKIGKTGMAVAERMIGMICALVAVKMILNGIELFVAKI